jgi:hypothetical protein
MVGLNTLHLLVQEVRLSEAKMHINFCVCLMKIIWKEKDKITRKEGHFVENLQCLKNAQN